METGAFRIYSTGKPPYHVVIVSSMFDRGLSYRAYAYKLQDKNVALVEFMQPILTASTVDYYVKQISSLGSTETIYIGQAFAGEIISHFPNSIVVSPTTFTMTSTIVVGTSDFDGSRIIAEKLEKRGIHVIWTKATHVTIPYADGICRALGSEDCSSLSGLFFKIIMAMIGIAFLFWWLYMSLGDKLEPSYDVPSVHVWLLLLLPLAGFAIPFVLKFYRLPILGIEEILPLAGFALLVGFFAGGKYRFTDFGVGLLLALIVYVVFMIPMYYLGIIPYITLNKLAVIPVIALFVSPYTVALERWRYHFSSTPFAGLWLPFVYLLLWFPFLLSAFFYTRLPFYHIFFYSYKFLWIHIFIGFVSLPFFRKHPDYVGLMNAYLWAIYMTLLLVEIA
ncbi:MAG: hypothetical protein GXO59_03795 [Dictyoglomi bacterium]|nr:hypothetical protein [Dictyoglomota bacterium]